MGVQQRARDLARMAAWLLPAGSAKNRILSRLGHRVHPTAIAKPNLVWKVGSIELGPNSRIGLGNVIKNLRSVSLAEHASIGRLNLLSSHPVYVRLYANGASVRLEPRASITSRHQLDCSGSLWIGELAMLAGHQSRVMSHSVDLALDAQAAHPVRIGERSFLGARCLLLGGAELPERSVLAAGSVLTRQREPGQPGLWAGVPAKRKADIDGAWFDRATTATRRVYVPETGVIIEDAL